MLVLDNKRLNELNHEGFICGPSENEEIFFKRCEALRDKKLLEERSKPLNVSLLEKIELKEFDLSIDWCCGETRKKTWLPWVAAETQIFEDERGLFPLVKILQKKREDEALKHEFLHVARCAFNENIFEEILAFKTSTKKWRRFWGALFRSSKERSLFLISILVALLFSWIESSSHLTEGVQGFPWIVLSLMAIRLVKDQRNLSKALIRLSKMFTYPQPLAIALRLTDKEIIAFSKESIDNLKRYIGRQSSLRWKQILASYPLND